MHQIQNIILFFLTVTNYGSIIHKLTFSRFFHQWHKPWYRIQLLPQFQPVLVLPHHISTELPITHPEPVPALHVLHHTLLSKIPEILPVSELLPQAVKTATRPIGIFFPDHHRCPQAFLPALATIASARNNQLNNMYW